MMDSFIIIVPKSEGQPHSQARAVIETQYEFNPVAAEEPGSVRKTDQGTYTPGLILFLEFAFDLF